MERSGLPSRGPSFNNYGDGPQNITTGTGNQFPGATFYAPVHLHHINHGTVLASLYTSPYRDRKDVNPDRVPGTCDWFVSHDRFLDWRECESSRMLWVSADPGCGKSVLAKYLVDFALPTTESRTVCYFFFKDGFEDQTNVAGALCCILHQLFKQKPKLLSTVLDRFVSGGETFIRSFSELWQTLIDVAKDENAGEIVCLFDAIDECEEQGWSQLAKALCKLYGTAANFNLKFLLTSRPYSTICRDFRPLDIPGLPAIHLSGESDDEMAKISREISVFIKARVQNIGARLRLTEKQQGVLLQQLMCVPNRTYLWAHLTLDLIEKAAGVDKHKILEITSQLPQTVDEAYDRILSKSSDLERAKKMLHITVAAARPLTLQEMNLALALLGGHLSYNELDPRPKGILREDVRDICGLFVTIINSKIYLLHQTAREFLVRNPGINSPQGTPKALKWKYALQPQESHGILANICIQHLLFEEFETHPLGENTALSQYVKGHIFLDYSAKNWATHVRFLPVESQKAMTESILKICDTNSRRFATWFRIYWTNTNIDFPTGFTTLMAASYFGLETAVECLRKKDGSHLDPRDDTHRRSALSWAAGNGFEVVVRLLIEIPDFGGAALKWWLRKNGRVNSADKYGRTPLTYAVWSGSMAVVELLIKAGIKVDSKDEIGGTPLSYAVCNGHKAIVELLLKKGTKVDSVDEISKELLFSAAKKGDEAVVELLVGTGKVDINTQDSIGATALHWVAREGHKEVISLLLKSAANVEVEDRSGGTPLAWAIEGGFETSIQVLLAETPKVNYWYYIVRLRFCMLWRKETKLLLDCYLKKVLYQTPTTTTSRRCR
ncbi:hypothetical protein QBC44DRAFT_301381 [Cladorrhinum sp. PSN332]|nr:hypothetical protein QBC44DRAFT_301381 [Cladorrhinum sp. PSN332]